MKDYTTENLRNVALIGHGGSGKTILADAIMFNAGATTRIGRVEDGTTLSDYRADEIEKQISINSTLLSAEYGSVKLNLMDTPGFTDFVGDVISSLKVVDTVFLVLKAVEGVEVGSELVWRYTKAAGSPAFILVNKMDNEHADFMRVVSEARDRFGAGVTAFQMPINKGATFSAMVDLLSMKLHTYATDGTGKLTVSDVPAEHAAKAQEMHEALIEKVAETSEDLMNTFFENGSLTPEELTKGLRSAIASNQIIPVFALAGQLNVGVRSVLDFLEAYGPSPADRPITDVCKAGSTDRVDFTVSKTGEPVLFVFKTLSEQHVGELSLFKVYGGTITPGIDLQNQTTNKTERLNQIFVMKGKERKDAASLIAGDIGAVVKLKDTHTNNTLSSKAAGVAVAPIEIPEPLITGAIKPKSKGDEDKIGGGLHTLHEEDPSFSIKVDTETHETIVLGQGEIHLDIMIKRLKQRFGVDVDLMPPRIPYRETVRKLADVSYKHKKQTGGAGQYGEVYIKLEPKPRGEGYEFVDAIVGGVISGRFVPAVDKGIQEQMVKGVVAGYPMVDMKITLYDGSQHTVDSNEMAFKIAAQQAFKKAVQDANPVLLEPIYNLEVIVPDEFMGDVMGDLSSRRGKIQGMDSEGPFQVIRAKVPLGELYQYATRLRSITQGRGLYRRSFSHYEEVPFEVQQKIIDEAKLAKEEES